MSVIWRGWDKVNVVFSFVFGPASSRHVECVQHLVLAVLLAEPVVEKVWTTGVPKGYLQGPAAERNAAAVAILRSPSSLPTYSKKPDTRGLAACGLPSLAAPLEVASLGATFP